MIYLDSSALLKLVFEERESAGLEAWVSEHANHPFVSSELAKVEVIRATRRLGSGMLPAARALLAGLDLVPLSGQVVVDAADLEELTLRSLDALHLASVLSLGEELSAFVVYDRRLSTAATQVGLRPLQPGT